MNNLFAIHTLGCKVNLFESNKVSNDMLASGYIQVDFNMYANIYIINTCSVTGIADSKSKNYIRRPKKINPNAIVIVMGCYAQMNSDDASKLDVDIWIGNKYKNEIINLIDEFLTSKSKIMRVENLLIEKEFENNSSQSFQNNTRAFIKIQDGCNFMCSYCIIPFARGKQRSKDLEDVIQEIKQLSQLKYKEIVLTGVNTAGYLDKDNNDFANLLMAINELKGTFRIRISSIEPFQINDQIINVVTNNQSRFCQHWHICLQSGSNRILKLMNRKYTAKQFLELISKIKQKSINSTFTTDYIVGFPTETDQDHNESITLINQIVFLKIHVFPYSKRKNTKAILLQEVDSTIKKQRIQEINALSEKGFNEVIAKFINKQVEVIFEEQDPDSPYQSGYSSEYIPVLYKINENIQNQKIILTGIKILDGKLLVGK